MCRTGQGVIVTPSSTSGITCGRRPSGRASRRICAISSDCRSVTSQPTSGSAGTSPPPSSNTAPASGVDTSRPAGRYRGEFIAPTPTNVRRAGATPTIGLPDMPLPCSNPLSRPASCLSQATLPANRAAPRRARRVTAPRLTQADMTARRWDFWLGRSALLAARTKAHHDHVQAGHCPQAPPGRSLQAGVYSTAWYAPPTEGAE